jgi:hypothetical protein
VFYDFTQNNSGGHFVTDDKICHRLLIEADSKREAEWIAEDLGVYFDGGGGDCPCCGDRWYRSHSDDPVDILEPYQISVSHHRANAEDLWQSKYGKLAIVEPPKWEEHGSTRSYIGKVLFRSIEEYAQYLADEWGWTTPDCRIFYKSGKVKEIFSKRARS